MSTGSQRRISDLGIQPAIAVRSFEFMALAAGDKLGPFEILAPIGAGGMGEVYRAKDSRIKPPVAESLVEETKVCLHETGLCAQGKLIAKFVEERVAVVAIYPIARAMHLADRNPIASRPVSLPDVGEPFHGGHAHTALEYAFLVNKSMLTGSRYLIQWPEPCSQNRDGFQISGYDHAR